IQARECYSNIRFWQFGTCCTRNVRFLKSQQPMHRTATKESMQNVILRSRNDG
ncbi:nitrous oxide-stimulated promoter family protein, partial [Vibrio parahaemolyticus V-223/04]